MRKGKAGKFEGHGVVGRRVIYGGKECTIEYAQGDLFSIKFRGCSIWPVHRSLVKFVRGDFREKGKIERRLK